MDEKFYVTITDINHGQLVANDDGEEVNEVITVPAGEKLRASDFPSEELLETLIAAGAVAEFKDVIVVEDTARIEALEAEKAEKDAEIEALKKALAEAQKLPDPAK
jgi:hypothetical protein